MEKIKTRGGAILLSRLGPLTFKTQEKWPRAPEKVGLWAFPYPYWEGYYTEHRYNLIVPKRLRDRGDWELNKGLDWEARDKWIQKFGNRVMPVRKFFYEGYLYSHISPRGYIGDVGDFNPDDVEWFELHSSELAKLILKTRGNKPVERVPGGGISTFKSSVDHLEVFIPRGAGKIFGAPKLGR